MPPQLSERSSGLYRILRNPRAYSGLQRALTRGDSTLATFVARHVRPDSGATLIDFGAGTGAVRAVLPDSVSYVAIEPNSAYCEAMREAFGSSASIECGAVETLERHTGTADIVLVLAVLHHVDDAEARRIMAAAHGALRAGGRLVTIDPCLHDGQHPVARLLARVDRGPYVRSPAAYAALAKAAFEHVDASVETDNLRVPYSHCILECRA